MNIVQLNEFITEFESVALKSSEDKRKKAFERIRTRLQKLQDTMQSQAKSNNQLVIVIVGQMNVGKSSLLNALLFEGTEVLPVAPTPMTACLTVIQHEANPEKQRFEVEYYTKEEWNDIKGKSNLVAESLNQIKQQHPEYKKSDCVEEFKEICKKEEADFETLMACNELNNMMLHHTESCIKIGSPNDSEMFSDLKDVAGRLNRYVGSSGDYTPVVKAVHLFISSDLLTYRNNNTGLTETYKIVDTPGINDPVESRDRVAKSFIREAHAAIMLIRADRSKTMTDLSFINSHIINGGMSKVLVTFNKFDLLLASENQRADNLLDTMEDYVGYIDGEYEDTGVFHDNFNDYLKPKLKNGEDAMYTAVCSLAEQMRHKLQKANGDISAAGLLDDETGLLHMLQDWFPDDFCEDNEDLVDNLKLIGGVDRLKNYFLLKEFLANKDGIVVKRYAKQNHLLCEDIVKQFDAEVREIHDNYTLLDSVDLSDLENQRASLKKLKENGLKKLYNCVDKTMYGLYAFVRLTLFAENLLPYKIKLKEDATKKETVSYTRKGTNTSCFGGKIKNENVEVIRVQPESVVSSHGKDIDALHERLRELWKVNFLIERDALVQSLLACIRTIATQDPSLGIDASVYTKALDEVVENVLRGREILNVGSWIDRQKIELDYYARKSDHTSLDTNFSETRMSKEEAQEKIKRQAAEKIREFQSGMSTRYIDFYDNLMAEVLIGNEDLDEKLTAFVKEDIESKLNAVFTRFINEKTQMINDRQKSENEKNQLVTDLNSLKAKFEQL